MAYNPFNAASGIVENKRKWANAKAKGEDVKPYEEGAAAYYKELRDNGRGDVADYLQKSDSITAGEYLKQLQPEYGVDTASLQKKSDNLYGVGVGTMDDISKTFDKVYENNINVDPTSTGYGKNILSGYGIAANEAYKGTLGGNAEDKTPVDYCSPCGVCRQVMREFCDADFEILIAKGETDYKSVTLADLLPMSFDKRNF